MHKLWGPVSLLLVLLGLVFYVYFGAVYGRFTDVGVYAVSIMLLATGAAGYWASLHLAGTDEA